MKCLHLQFVLQKCYLLGWWVTNKIITKNEVHKSNTYIVSSTNRLTEMHKCTHVLHSLRILLEPTISNVLNNWLIKLRLNLKTLKHVEQAKYQLHCDKTLHQLKHTMLYLTNWNFYVLMKKYPCSSSSCEHALTIY